MNLVSDRLRRGKSTWIIDVMAEYSPLLNLPYADRLLTVSSDDLKVNLIEPSGPWMSEEERVGEACLLMRGTMFLRNGSLNLLRDLLMKMLQERMASAGNAGYPALDEILTRVRGLRFGPRSRNAGYVESLVNRLTMMNDVFGSTFNVTHSELLPFLAERSVIFRLSNLSGIPLQFLTRFLLLWLVKHRTAFSEGDFLVVIEEAHLQSAAKERMDIGSDFLSYLFRTGRHSQVRFCINDQVPSLLSPEILANIDTCVSFQLVNGRCIWTVAGSRGLTREQAARLPELEPRHAIVHSSVHPPPFEIVVPEMSFPPPPGEEEMRRRTEEALSGVRWVEYVPPAEAAALRGASRNGTHAGPHDLLGDEVKVMVRICEYPAELIEERCDALKMDRAREFRARKSLVAKGFLTETEETLGNKMKFFEATGKGRRWAEKHGFKVRVYKSGPLHDYLLGQVEKQLGKVNTRFGFQRHSEIGRGHGLQPDCVMMMPPDQRAIIEICCHNMAYEAKNLVAESGVNAVDLVVAVAPNRRTKGALERALEKAWPAGNTGKRAPVVILDAGECLSRDFDWVAVLERE
jgi:hypothetical protein